MWFWASCGTLAHAAFFGCSDQKAETTVAVCPLNGVGNDSTGRIEVDCSEEHAQR